MREIKFSYVYQHADTGRILIKEFDIHEIELELMGECFIEGYTLIARRQYTGLFDKNGVEIYENDIVKCPLGVGYIDYTESYFRIFRPFVFSTNLCNETNSNDLDAKNKVEVIGNIYQNKELLNTKG